jgi:hypothetical protein
VRDNQLTDNRTRPAGFPQPELPRRRRRRGTGLFGFTDKTLHSQIDPPAQATAGGLISIATSCGTASAAGGVSVGSSAAPTVTINGVPIPISVGDESISQPFIGNLACNTDDCSIDISIATGMYVAASANATMINWSASALAEIDDAALNLTINPECLSGEVESPGPIQIGFISVSIE